MIIAVAGPYSADTEEQKQINIDELNKTAAKLLELGHIPLIGINAAVPVLKFANIKNEYKAIMNISLSVTSACEALLLLSESPGANKERDLILTQNKPVFRSINELINYSESNKEQDNFIF